MPRIDNYGDPGTVADGDEFPMWDASSSTVKAATPAQIAAYVAASDTLTDRVLTYTNTPGEAPVRMVAACALRNNGSPNYWQPLSDSTHYAIGISSVTTDGTRITVNLTTNSTKRITGLVVTDETLAAAGYTAGASFGGNVIEIELGNGPLTDYITYNGSAWTTTNGNFTVVSYTAGVLELSHIKVPQNGAMVCGRGGIFVPQLSNGSNAVGETTTKIEFYNWSGVKQTTATTDMKCSVMRAGRGAANPQEIDTTLYPLSNLWVLAFASLD